MGFKNKEPCQALCSAPLGLWTGIRNLDRRVDSRCRSHNTTVVTLLKSNQSNDAETWIEAKSSLFLFSIRAFWARSHNVKDDRDVTSTTQTRWNANDVRLTKAKVIKLRWLDGSNMFWSPTFEPTPPSPAMVSFYFFGEGIEIELLW